MSRHRRPAWTGVILYHGENCVIYDTAWRLGEHEVVAHPRPGQAILDFPPAIRIIASPPAEQPA